jgi:hypothetical protein
VPSQRTDGAVLIARTSDHLREPFVFAGDNKHALSQFGRAHRVGLFPCLFSAGAPVRRIPEVVVSRLVFGHTTTFENSET